MGTDHLRVGGAADPARDEFEGLFLHRPHAADQGLFGHRLSVGCYCTANVLTHHFVHIQHVKVDSAQL